MKVDVKRLVGIGIIVAGIALILFSLNAMRRIAEAKDDVRALSRPLSVNPIGKMVGKSLEDKASQYDTDVMLCLIGGIVLVVAGAGVCLHRTKKSKR